MGNSSFYNKIVTIALPTSIIVAYLFWLIFRVENLEQWLFAVHLYWPVAAIFLAPFVITDTLIKRVAVFLTPALLIELWLIFGGAAKETPAAISFPVTIAVLVIILTILHYVLEIMKRENLDKIVTIVFAIVSLGAIALGAIHINNLEQANKINQAKQNDERRIDVINYCNGLKTDWEKGACYIDAAYRINDISLCEKIPPESSSYKQSCRASFGVH